MIKRIRTTTIGKPKRVIKIGVAIDPTKAPPIAPKKPTTPDPKEEREDPRPETPPETIVAPP
jgi:hypothetical protein